jgi:hypothetical protein
MKPLNAECVQNAELLGAFANLLKRVLDSLCSSVCLSLSTGHIISHWTDFREILYWVILLKSVEKIQG